MDEDIKKKVEAAIKAGAPAQEAVARGQALQAQRGQAAPTQPSPPTPQPQQTSLPENIGNGIIDIGKAVAQPFTQWGHLMGGMLNDISGGKVNFGQKLTPEETQKMSNPLSPDNPIYRDTAGLASFAVPFGKGANIATKALIPGAAVGAGQEASKPDSTLPAILGSGALGAGTAGLIYGAGKLVNKLANKSAQGGQALKDDIVNPKVQTSANSYAKEQELLQKAKDLGVTGNTSEAMRKSSAEIYQGLLDDLEALPSKSAKTTSVINTLKNGVVKDGSYFLPGDKTYEKVLDRELNIMQNNLGEEDVTAQSLGKLKGFLSGRISKGAWTAGANTVQDQVKVDLYHQLDNVIGDLAGPGAKDITLQMQTLHQLAPGLEQAANKTASLSPLGIPTGINLNQPLQAVKSGIGSAMQLPAILANKIAESPATPQIAGQIASRGVPAAFSQDSSALPPIESAGSQTANTQSLPPISDNPYPTDNYVKDITRDPKNADKYKAIYDAYQKEYPNASGGVGKVSAQSKGLAKTGLRSVQDVRAFYKEDPHLLDKQLVPGQFFSRKFDSALYDAVDALLRLRTGAQANPSEIRGYMTKIGPTWGDGPDVVEYKLDKLDKDFQDYATGAAGSAIDQSINTPQTTLPQISAY